jgi:proteasome beta subunit
MTIVIALSCSDGVVMASDSQATEPYAGVRYNVQKVFQLSDRAVWGGTGDAQTVAEINRALQAIRPAVEGGSDLIQLLPVAIHPVLRQRYATFMQAPGTQVTSPATGTLVCGYDSSRGGWIVEVDPNCMSTDHGPRGFHAVGSGAGFAFLGNALLAHFRPAERPLSQGRLIAYRVIDAAVEASGSGVGGPIQMWWVDSAGVHQANEDEINETRSSVGAWQEEEGKLLDQVFGKPEPELAPLPSPSSVTTTSTGTATGEPG